VPQHQSLSFSCLCVFAALSSAAHNKNFFVSLSIRFCGWLLCLLCWEAISSLPTLQFQLNIVMMFEPVLFLLLLNCCDANPPTIRARKLVDCYVCEGLQQLHPPPAHLLCTSRPRGASLVHSHQTISVVLMAESAASARSPTAADVTDDVGWVKMWFWGIAEAAGHGFGGGEGSK
jgi:hypothetical protein